jgi:hypothetical protein
VILRILGLLVGVSAAAGLALWWPWMRPGRRRAVALAVSAAGLAFLVIAMTTEGLREAPTETVYLVGTPYVTGQASASASLPYYVLTALCLLLGTAGLALDDEKARWLARHWLATATCFTLLVTALRFLLEKAAVTSAWTRAVGVVWLPPIVGAFFALRLRDEAKGFRALVRSLIAYALIVRGAVAALSVVATRLQLGTHYDVSALTKVETLFTHRVLEFTPGGLDQILSLIVMPQLVVWPLFTLAGGLIGAGLALTMTSTGKSPDVPTVHTDVGVAAAGKGR